MAESSETDDILNKIQQKQLDDILLEQAYNNAWLVLSGQLSFDELLQHEFKTGKEFIMAFDPEDGPNENELQNMIEFYIDEEQYERCAKLQSILEKTYPNINV